MAIEYRDGNSACILKDLKRGLIEKYGIPRDAVGIFALDYAIERLEDLDKQNTEVIEEKVE